LAGAFQERTFAAKEEAESEASARALSGKQGLIEAQRTPQVVPSPGFMFRTAKTAPRRWELSIRRLRQNGANVVQDEQLLIRAARRGDSVAFGKLVRAYQDRLCTALLHVCGSMDDAEDVAQEAFVAAYLKLASFAGDSAFYTWLYRIAFNAAISRRRRQREEMSVEETRERSGHEPFDDCEPAEERVLREERAVQVQRALSLLSDEHRAILVLREVEGCDYDAIAVVLNVPVGTVRSRLHRARLHLKEQLDAILGETERHK
jgi:RNA polymerase sigma-70 factor (ECF subfamily)